MSRILEIVSHDPMDIVSKRAYRAFKRIGRVDEYDPEQFIEGRINVDGYTAFVTIEWRKHRDTERVRLDIAASSNDTLSRAADQAMYLFAHTFKEISPEDLDKKESIITPKLVMLSVAGLVVAAGVAAFLLKLPPFAQ